MSVTRYLENKRFCETRQGSSVHRQRWGDKTLQPWHVGGPLLAVPGTERSPAKRIDPSAPADTNRSLQV